jgi:hypothetical protein
MVLQFFGGTLVEIRSETARRLANNRITQFGSAL